MVFPGINRSTTKTKIEIPKRVVMTEVSLETILE